MSLIEATKAQRTYSVSGRLTGYVVDLTHTGLKEHRVLKAAEFDLLQRKVDTLVASWEEKWERVSDRQSKAEQKATGKQTAEERSDEASAIFAATRSILRDTLTRNDAIDWRKLEDHREFVFQDTRRFQGLKFARNGEPTGVLVEKPDSSDPRFAVKPTLLDRLFSSRMKRKLDESKARFDAEKQEWDRAVGILAQGRKAYETALTGFRNEQQQVNEKVQALRDRYLKGDPAAILQNCELVLSNSIYPDYISKDFVLNYSAETRILVCDYQLVDKAAMPRLEKVTYVASRNEYKETLRKDSEVDKLYDDLLYQMAIRTIHELFEGDTADALDSVVFNGWVDAVNPATGKRVNGCLLSLQAGKKEFSDINLAHVDPKACFKSLKGVSASKLSGMIPIKPILQLERDDPRFVAGQGVVDGIDARTNLAAMDWEDFEHLIREVFAKEFSSPGSEVKITRASSDGGVDAVVFDPDPLRGGKIVIQAKRYTNTVGVSAVRDLYGTLMNEGAGKGILVTTADFGPDAHAFAKDKPLVLLSGSHLLHLLNKHGHQARIDVQEARSLRIQESAKPARS
jgi:restriction system protein